MIRAARELEHLRVDCYSRIRLRTPRGAEVLIKRRSPKKNVIDGRHFADAPLGDILVEKGGISEQPLHTADVRCVPAGNILVESDGAVKSGAHVLDLRGIPITDVLVKF